jgi:hypothetical protein
MRELIPLVWTTPVLMQCLGAGFGKQVGKHAAVSVLELAEPEVIRRAVLIEALT